MAAEHFENVIHPQVKDHIVSACLQLNCTSNTQSAAATFKQPIAAPASTDHHTIMAFKEKASVQRAPWPSPANIN